MARRYNLRVLKSAPRIILASASPRRLELLKEIVPEFDVMPSEFPERERGDPWSTAASLSLGKALAVARRYPEAIVIGADTVVAYQEVGWRQLAKPADEEDAREMLKKLSMREHVVITAVSVVRGDTSETASETTRVRFRALTDREIADYVATGEPMDKAGAYAIQGGARDFITNVEGSISNVIGLPLDTLRPMLNRAFEG